ncbi:MAG: HAMP domain-containing protein, partial [Candidatus Pacebacteria bacterium]|nr:HAMP domain-containing protein [Candidatus Paceibacterota bacterium]
YWGFFFGTLIFFLVLNLPDRSLKIIYTHFLTTFGSLAVFFIGFLWMIYTVPFFGWLFSESIFVAIIGVEILFILLLFSFIKGSKAHNKSYSIYFIVGLSILAFFVPSTFFVVNWTLLWWFHVAMSVFGFSFLLTGFLKKEKSIGKIEEMFPQVVFYSRIGMRFIIYVFVIFVLAIGVSVYFFSKSRDQQIEYIIADRETSALFIVDNIEDRFKNYFADFEKMCDLDEIDNLVLALDNIESDDAVNMAIKHVSLVFEGYVNIKPQYKRIFYINEEGQEIVFVESRSKEQVKPDMANVYDQEYFQESIDKNEGELYVSDIVIDPESLEGSLDPIMHIASPVFDHNKKFRGVVMLDIDATDFMDIVRHQKITKKGVFFSLVDQEGRFIVEPNDPEYEYWRNSPDPHKISLLCEHFRDHSFSGVITHCEEQIEHEEGSLTEKKVRKIVTHARVLYLPNNEESYFVVVEQTPEDVVLAEAQKDFMRNIFALGFVLGGSFFLMYIISIRSIVNRVSRNAAAVRRLGSGDFSIRVEVQGDDEVAEISKGVNCLADELERRQKEQETQEEELLERTKKAEEINTSLEKTRDAVMNILEDLDEEKKWVEEKVEERTKELREEKGKLDHVTQHMRTGVIFLNYKGEVLVVNKTMRNILNFRGKNDQDVLKALQDKFKGIDLKNSLATCNVAKEFNNREVEVEDKIYSIAVRREEEGGIEEETKKDNFGGIFVWVEDVTEDKLVERSKSELVATASHQLRTPLTVARGNVEMLLDEDFGSVNDKQREMLKDTSDSVIRLIAMVNDMLDITKIEKGDLELIMEEFNIEELIGSVIEHLEDYADRHDFEVVFNKPNGDVMVVADKEHLQQVFQNLIDNAIRYSRQPGKVEITILKKGKDVEVIIKDNGIGIPKAEQSNIFGRFYRAANAVRFASGGSGLGLFIVKSFVEQMGGRVWFESKENEGAAFHVLLPFKKQ